MLVVIIRNNLFVRHAQLIKHNIKSEIRAAASISSLFLYASRRDHTHGLLTVNSQYQTIRKKSSSQDEIEPFKFRVGKLKFVVERPSRRLRFHIPVISALWRLMDPNFTQKSFLIAAEQAVIQVSSLISQGKFDALNGLVSSQAVEEIRKNYDRLNSLQCKSIAVEPEDLYDKFIYVFLPRPQIDWGKKYDVPADIFTVWLGYRGYGELKKREPVNFLQEMKKYPKNFFVCNYYFSGGWTSTVIDDVENVVHKDWMITALSHFCPTDI